MTKGGKREGAGRKPSPVNIKRVRYTIRLPYWLIKWLKKQNKSCGKLIERALINYYEIEEKGIKEDEQ